MEEVANEYSTFHGNVEYDYQGRTYISVPTDLNEIDLQVGEPGDQECFVPKRLIHTFTGHTKPVSAIRFFPDSGHLLLSCSMDTRIKVPRIYLSSSCGMCIMIDEYCGPSMAILRLCATLHFLWMDASSCHAPTTATSNYGTQKPASASSDLPTTKCHTVPSSIPTAPTCSFLGALTRK
jgi:WD40 repeat protein